ncbi:helix-turn-helix domain-containing protein [Undibacterium sp. Rencai35W]|uniref:helix-turn-helix domain-containing protein n=1 Tax=Undibacterium sp. Rencai35W TaxID=3413046 RepID=UPI003BF3DD2C
MISHFSISESKKQAYAKLAFAKIRNMETVRIKQLRKLISENFNGSQTELSNRSGVSLSQLGQYLGGYRNLGEKTARKIESAAGKNIGWLDGVNPETTLSPYKLNQTPAEYQLTKPKQEEPPAIDPMIAAVIKIMEQTDERGRRKMLSACEDIRDNYLILQNRVNADGAVPVIPKELSHDPDFKNALEVLVDTFSHKDQDQRHY